MYPVDPSLRKGVPILPVAEASPGLGSIGLDLSEILSQLRRRRRWIAVWTGAFMLVGLLAALSMKTHYAASTQILIDPRGLQVVDKEVTPNGQGSDMNGAIVETQAQVLTSDLVLRQVVAREHLADDPEFNGSPTGALGLLKARLRAALGATGTGPDPALIALSVLRERVKVQRTPGSFVVELYAATLDPEKSARLAQAVAQSFIDSQVAARRNAARGASDALSGRLEELRNEVNEAEGAVERFKVQNNIVGANGRLVNEQQLTELSNQLVAARARTSELKTRYEQITSLQRSGAAPDTVAEAIRSPAVAQLRSQFAETKRLEDDLVAKLGPRHPDLAAIRAQSNGLRQQIQNELKRIAAAAGNDYRQAQAHEDNLSRSLGAQTSATNSVNSLLIRLRELDREAQARRLVYENFLNRTRETREQQEIDTANTRILSPAVPPLKPVGIPPFLLVIVAAAVGMSLGALSAIARHFLDGKVHTPRQFSAATGLPVLAVLPQPAALRPADGGVELFLDRLPDGPAAHAIYRLHDLLGDEFSVAARIVLVTSPDDASGRSTVALNLALAARLRGAKVLLIDADSAGRTLSRLFRADQGPTLHDVYLKGLPVAQAVRMVAGGRIGFVAAGMPARGAAEGFDKVALRQYLAEAAGSFDLIVIDGGLAGRDPGVRTFMEAATRGLLVVRADVTALDRVEDVRAGFGTLAGKMAGAVLVTGAPTRTRKRRGLFPQAKRGWGGEVHRVADGSAA